jgi:hypothetical protein
MKTNNLDFLGQEVCVGDNVIFMQLNYRNLMTGEVIGVTPKKFKIRHTKTNVGSQESIQEKNQVIKIPIVPIEKSSKCNLTCLMELLQPALNVGCSFDIYSEQGIPCIDLNTGAKSGCILKIENGEFIAYRRYDRRNQFSTFDELLGLVYECCHGRSYFDGNWLTLFQMYGYHDPRGTW